MKGASGILGVSVRRLQIWIRRVRLDALGLLAVGGGYLGSEINESVIHALYASILVQLGSLKLATHKGYVAFQSS